MQFQESICFRFWPRFWVLNFSKLNFNSKVPWRKGRFWNLGLKLAWIFYLSSVSHWTSGFTSCEFESDKEIAVLFGFLGIASRWGGSRALVRLSRPDEEWWGLDGILTPSFPFLDSFCLIGLSELWWPFCSGVGAKFAWAMCRSSLLWSSILLSKTLSSESFFCWWNLELKGSCGGSLLPSTRPAMSVDPVVRVQPTLFRDSNRFLSGLKEMDGSFWN